MFITPNSKGSTPHVSFKIASVTKSVAGTVLLNEIKIFDSPVNDEPKFTVSSDPKLVIGFDESIAVSFVELKVDKVWKMVFSSSSTSFDQSGTACGSAKSANKNIMASKSELTILRRSRVFDDIGLGCPLAEVV